MGKSLVIYHGNCADGFTAAWVAHSVLGDNADYYPGVYQQDPPDVTGRAVIMVDFSYKREVILQMAALAEKITIIDHHKTAIEDLAGLDQLEVTSDQCQIETFFDTERSGAMLTWDFYHDGLYPAPVLVSYVQDRDLWRFKLPRSRQFSAALFAYEYDFDTWSAIASRVEGPAGFASFTLEGDAIERKHHKDVAELIKVCKRRMVIGGYDVPVASLPYVFSSDAGHSMCGDHEPFAACYWDTPAGRCFSLRSTHNGLDVSEIAKQYGGGGHRNAAGFSVGPDHPLAQHSSSMPKEKDIAGF